MPGDVEVGVGVAVGVAVGRGVVVAVGDAVAVGERSAGKSSGGRWERFRPALWSAPPVRAREWRDIPEQ